MMAFKLILNIIKENTKAQAQLISLTMTQENRLKPNEP